MELAQILMMAVPTVLGAVVGSFTTYIKTHRERDKAQLEGMRILMRLELRELHKRICIEGCGCSVDDKNDATSIYNVYKALGGNGSGESMYKDIMAAKVTE